MSLDFDLVIVAIVALAVLLLAGAGGMWRRRGRRATTYAPLPTSRTDLAAAVTYSAGRHPVGRQPSVARGLEHAQRLPRSPEAGLERGIIRIVAVYRTDPVMVVGETAAGALLEHSIHELADVHELLPPRLWQELAEQYHVFRIR